MGRVTDLMARFTDLVGEADRNGQLREEAAAQRAHSLTTSDRAVIARYQAERAKAVRDAAAAEGDYRSARAADGLVKSKTARAKTWDARSGHVKQRYR